MHTQTHPHTQNFKLQSEICITTTQLQVGIKTNIVRTTQLRKTQQQQFWKQKQI